MCQNQQECTWKRGEMGKKEWKKTYIFWEIETRVWECVQVVVSRVIHISYDWMYVYDLMNTISLELNKTHFSLQKKTLSPSPNDYPWTHRWFSIGNFNILWMVLGHFSLFPFFAEGIRMLHGLSIHMLSSLLRRCIQVEVSDRRSIFSHSLQIEKRGKNKGKKNFSIPLFPLI